MPESPTIRVALADDHPIVLQGLHQLFERSPDFIVAGAFRTGAEALAAVRQGQIDVLVLDMRMPGMSGLDVLRAIKQERLAVRPVLLTAALRDAEVAEVVHLGAQGLVLKESTPESLVECVRAVFRGEQWIDRAAMTRAFDRVIKAESGRQSGVTALTPRELEIVRMVSQGLRNREIAVRLFISEGTVKIHLHNAYEKLGVDGRLELLLYAQERGLI